MPRKPEKILNYKTSVEASKTVGEIVQLLAGKKVSSINLDYNESEKVGAITFVVKVADSLIPFKLKPNIEGVYKRPEICSQGMSQAERVAWRIVLRWVEAQLAMVESNLAEMGQVFLPYAMRGDGETLWQAFQASNTKQLGNGE
jgi:hypothetical protein